MTASKQAGQAGQKRCGLAAFVPSFESSHQSASPGKSRSALGTILAEGVLQAADVRIWSPVQGEIVFETRNGDLEVVELFRRHIKYREEPRGTVAECLINWNGIEMDLVKGTVCGFPIPGFTRSIRPRQVKASGRFDSLLDQGALVICVNPAEEIPEWNWTEYPASDAIGDPGVWERFWEIVEAPYENMLAGFEDVPPDHERWVNSDPWGTVSEWWNMPTAYLESGPVYAAGVVKRGKEGQENLVVAYSDQVNGAWHPIWRHLEDGVAKNIEACLGSFNA